MKKTTPPASRGSQKTKNDVLLIAALLLIVSAASLALFLFRTSGDTVIVTVDGNLFGEYSLNENDRIEIRKDDGYNWLVIENGKAYVETASCPDGICSSHRPIEHNGESIICLPNKVVIEVHTREDGKADIIT